MVNEQLAARGIVNEQVLGVMRTVPRQSFVPAEQLADAYADPSLNRSYEKGVTRTLESPYVIASVAEQLSSQPAGRVLEVGTGAGYQAAVLSRLCKEVYTMDSSKLAADCARVALDQTEFAKNVIVSVGDYTAGWPEAAPFDVIIMNGDVSPSDALLGQFNSGGRLIVPVGGDNNLHVFQKFGDRLVPSATKPARPAPVADNQIELPPVKPILVRPM